jgi:hypothetical protein
MPTLPDVMHCPLPQAAHWPHSAPGTNPVSKAAPSPTAARQTRLGQTSPSAPSRPFGPPDSLTEFQNLLPEETCLNAAAEWKRKKNPMLEQARPSANLRSPKLSFDFTPFERTVFQQVTRR